LKGAIVSEDNKLNANDTLSKVLAYVDSPFKLFALVLMAVLAFSGYFVYENKEVLIGAYKESKRAPDINEDRAEDAATMLFRQTGAQFVAIFKVNQMFGTRVLYRAYTKEGREKSVEGIDVGLFSQNSANNADLIKLMENETPCSEYKEPQSEIGLWYVAQGVTFTCRASVPPDSFRFFGQITVGWKDRPDNVEQTKTMMGIAASMLTRKGP
jgi:hypothetical protein